MEDAQIVGWGGKMQCPVVSIEGNEWRLDDATAGGTTRDGMRIDIHEERMSGTKEWSVRDGESGSKWHGGGVPAGFHGRLWVCAKNTKE
jgi:hypothetical protein